MLPGSRPAVNAPACYGPIPRVGFGFPHPWVGTRAPGAGDVARLAPLEDPRWRWIQWQRRRFGPFELPAVGQRVRLVTHLP